MFEILTAEQMKKADLQTIAEGIPQEVANNQAVIEAYLGEQHAQG